MATEKEILLIEIREDGAHVVKRNIQDIGTSADGVQGSVKKLKTLLGGLVTTKVIKDTVMLADTYANLMNRLRVVTSGTYELTRAMEGIADISRETRSALESNVDMYARVAINTKQLGMVQEDVLRFSRQLNHAIILSGVTAREAQWGMVQFSQALASNALRGDELRAVLEQLPVVTDVIAKHFGVTRGELRKLGFEGRITAKDIIEAFNEAEAELAEKFGRRIPTIDQGLTVIRSSFIRFLGEQDQAVQGTATFARLLLWVGDNMETVGRLTEMVAIVIGGVLLTNLIKMATQWKLLSLSVFRSHAALMIFLTAAAAISVYSNKIKVANDSNATLADTMRALGERAATTYTILREKVAEFLNPGDVHTEYVVTFKSISMDAAKFIDYFLGLFVGSGQVIAKVAKDIPGFFVTAWNSVLSATEFVVDGIMALFSTIGDSLKIFALNVKTMMIALSGAVNQALSGNVDQAKQFAEVAANSMKKAATDGFANFKDIYQRNFEEATSEDSLGQLKGRAEASGETFGEAFMRGFNMSTLVGEGVESLFDRADQIAQERDAGKLTGSGSGAIQPMTPIEQELLKDITGDLGNLQAKLEALDNLYQRGDISIGQYTRKLAELRQESLATATDAASGFKRGFYEVGLEITNFSDMAQKTVTNAFGGMEDALVSFVTKGKVDFKALVDGMLADLTRLLARMLIVKALGSLGGGVGDFFSGAMGGGGSNARAGGGSVSAGQPYIINDDSPGMRPELFIPDSNGTVVNSREAQGVAAATSPEVNVKVLCVWDKSDVIDAMDSTDGERVIIARSPGKNTKY